MKQICVYSVKLVRDSAKRYDVPDKILTPESAAEAIRQVTGIDDAAEERLGFLALNVKNKIIGVHIVNTGILNSSICHPREVFKRALLNNAYSILLFHNHPSGDPTPSDCDVDMTKEMIQVGFIMKINVIDSIILGENKLYSFKAIDPDMFTEEGNYIQNKGGN